MITLMSWGNKFGSPPANYKFDVSFFKNPWRDEKIRNEKDATKRKEMIIKFMDNQKGVPAMLSLLYAVCIYLNDEFPDENIAIALCCSAGEYRSPAMVHALSAMLTRRKIEHIIKQSNESKI